MVACSIIRGDKGEIMYTEAPNGARSILFDSLIEKTKDTREALSFWLVSKTKKFKDTVSGPLLNQHRTKLLNGLNEIQTKEPTIEVLDGGKGVKLDIQNMEFTNLTPSMGPKALTTLNAYAFPVDGGKAVKLGRIRYKIKGNTIEIDSSLLQPLSTYRNGKISNIKGLGIGGKMYAELFKYALKEGFQVTSSDNLSPDSTALWEKLVGLGLARVNGNRFVLNSYPSNFDVNGEINMGALLDFIDREGVSSGVTIEEETTIRQAMIGMNVNSSQELLSKMKLGFFPDGYFRPTRESLSRAGIYNSEEITDILTDEALQTKIRDFIYKLEQVQEPILNDIYLDDTFLVVKDGTKNEIGKFKVENPYLIEKKVIDTLGGIEVRSEFEEEMMEDDTTSAIADKYVSTMNTNDDLFNRMSKYKPVAELTVEENQLVPVTSGTREYMEQVLKEPSSGKLESNLDFIISLDNSLWREAPKELTTLLKGVTNDLLDIGLDATGLLDQAKKKSIEDTKEFLEAARLFAIDANQNTFDRLVDAYDEYFDIEGNFKYRKQLLPKNIDKTNTFYLETHQPGVSMFNTLGLVPVGKNLYKRVEKESVDYLIDAVINHSFATNGYETILPMEAFYPAAYDEDGTINMSKLQDRDNALALRESVANFVVAETKKIFTDGMNPIPSEDLQRYVLMFNYYNRSNDYSKFDPKPTKSREYGLMVDNIDNLGYLATDFIADFNTKMLKEKLKDSAAYRDFYSNFRIGSSGIELVNDDPITKSNMAPYLEENKDLVNYFKYHKNKEPLIDEVVDDPLRDDLFMRNYYTNYPTALKPFTGEFYELGQGTIAARTKAPFIRTNKGVYELVKGIGRVGVYGKLEVNTNPFKRYDLNMTPPKLDEVTNKLKNTDKNISSAVEVKHLYDEAEKEEIDRNYDNC